MPTLLAYERDEERRIVLRILEDWTHETHIEDVGALARCDETSVISEGGQEETFNRLLNL